ncbi:MAG: hypothetical protein U1F83_11685 [Verrucomicrobiota bacterium]
MSDVQLLFVVLAVLYGMECFCWLRRGGVAFTTWLGRHWQVRHPDALAGNQSGGFLPAPPLPPLGALFVANQFPLSLSPDGVLAFVATNVNPGWRPAQSGRFVSWKDLREVRVRGKKVLVNGQPFLTAATSGLARQLGSELKRLLAMKPAERADAIVQLAKKSMDPDAIAARRGEWRQHARPVRWLANLLVVYIFAVAPALIWHFGFLLCWLWLLLGLLTLTFTTATLFARAHRALYPEAHDERFTHTLTIALAPTSAMRAHDALSRPLLETFHPLAVAKVSLKDEDFRRFARGLLLDLRQPALPLCPNEMPEAQSTERFFRRTLLTVTEEFLTRGGVTPGELGHSPVPGDESSRAYCPRCEAQFTSVEGRCADCGGLPLVAFKSKLS